MNYQQITKKANELHNAGTKIKYFDMVLHFSLQDLKESRLKEITEAHVYELLSLMTDYLDNCYHVSAYDAADAITNCINKYGVEVFLANGEQLMIDELCCM